MHTLLNGFQLLYWFMLSVGALSLARILFNTSIPGYETLLGFFGGVLALLGIDGLMGAVFYGIEGGFFTLPGLGIPGLHPVFGIAPGWSCLLLLIGACLVHDFERFEDRIEARRVEISHEWARQRVIYKGTLVAVRKHNDKRGEAAGTEQCYEIETSSGVYLVEGEIGLVKKGVPVYTNEAGELYLGHDTGRRMFRFSELHQ